MLSDDALPRASESSSTGAQASQTSEALASERALQAWSIAEGSAASLLALAERRVRWEDDVSAAEIAVFEQLYQQVLQRARLELGLPEPEAKRALDPGVAHEHARTALLQLRVEANELVRRVAQTTRSSPASEPRLLRYLLGAVVLLGLAAFLARDAIVDRLDLGNISQGKPWRVSSTHNATYPAVGTLGNFSDPFFFHTAQEASPWIEVDLGADAHVSSLLVQNRRDCCANRTVPLVVETSRDHSTWQIVATRQRGFSKWRPSVDVSARWVRLRVLRESILHLRVLIIRS